MFKICNEILLKMSGWVILLNTDMVIFYDHV